MAMAGIPAVIPYDECVAAMKQIVAMPESLRETSKGGLASSHRQENIRRAAPAQPIEKQQLNAKSLSIEPDETRTRDLR